MRHEGPQRELRCSYTLSLTWALDVEGAQRHPQAALPQGTRPGTHSVGRWIGSRVGQDGCGKSRLHRESIPGLSSP